MSAYEIIYDEPCTWDVIMRFADSIYESFERELQGLPDSSGRSSTPPRRRPPPFVPIEWIRRATLAARNDVFDRHRRGIGAYGNREVLFKALKQIRDTEVHIVTVHFLAKLFAAKINVSLEERHFKGEWPHDIEGGGNHKYQFEILDGLKEQEAYPTIVLHSSSQHHHNTVLPFRLWGGLACLKEIEEGHIVIQAVDMVAAMFQKRHYKKGMPLDEIRKYLLSEEVDEWGRVKELSKYEGSEYLSALDVVEGALEKDPLEAVEKLAAQRRTAKTSNVPDRIGNICTCLMRFRPVLHEAEFKYLRRIWDRFAEMVRLLLGFLAELTTHTTAGGLAFENR